MQITTSATLSMTGAVPNGAGLTVIRRPRLAALGKQRERRKPRQRQQWALTSGEDSSGRHRLRCKKEAIGAAIFP
jgi:hypothetical protein